MRRIILAITLAATLGASGCTALGLTADIRSPQVRAGQEGFVQAAQAAIVYQTAARVVEVISR